MTVPPEMTTPNTIHNTPLRTLRTLHTLTYSGSESDSNLDRVVLNPSPCGLHINTDNSSHAYETVMDSYLNIPPPDD